eukprot:m.292604 g.292604  ORF g.292604 m.292604 type:complete len:456 (-) comp20004_c1_seq1:400-1767(-)
MSNSGSDMELGEQAVITDCVKRVLSPSDATDNGFEIVTSFDAEGYDETTNINAPITMAPITTEDGADEPGVEKEEATERNDPSHAVDRDDFTIQAHEDESTESDVDEDIVTNIENEVDGRDVEERDVSADVVNHIPSDQGTSGGDEPTVEPIVGVTVHDITKEAGGISTKYEAADDTTEHEAQTATLLGDEGDDKGTETLPLKPPPAVPDKTIAHKATSVDENIRETRSNTREIPDLGIFSGLPPAVADLVLYKNPVHSVVALGGSLVTYCLLFCNLHVVWLILMVAKVAILLTFVPTVAKALYDQHVNGQTEYTPLSRVLLEPMVARGVANATPYLCTRADVVAAVEAAMSAALRGVRDVADVLYCKNWKTTALALVKVHVAARFFRCCSVSGLVLTFLIFMGSAPAGYMAKKAEIDAALQATERKLRTLHATIIASVPTSILEKLGMANPKED